MKVHRLSAELLKQHLKAGRLQILTTELAALECLPTAQIDGAVAGDHFIRRGHAELFKRQTDGGLFRQFEVIDRFIRVEENDVESFRQTPLPLWCRSRHG